MNQNKIFYNSLPLPGKAKYIQSVNEFAEGLLLNVELMDLISYCEEAIGHVNCLDIQDKVQEFLHGS